MEKPGHLLGADSSSEQFLHEGKEGVERGTDVCAGSRWAWAWVVNLSATPPAIPPPSPGMALNTEGSTKGELVWGVSPHQGIAPSQPGTAAPGLQQPPAPCK